MMKITSWRIIKVSHIDSAFNGEGARIAGGRWNKIGTPMVYTAGSLALAALEIIVHLPIIDLLKKHFGHIPVRFDAKLVHCKKAQILIASAFNFFVQF